ncbi:3TM-type holin [uncultured Paraglaciecola sp.]|uniref:3TM-type holin n=1 Tax=uncultured Paraglaciecola sp. TaxID=1765024 RepID=UPI002614276F|nr:3TM-type holin [uncultured Paraglaciecola sp.]
MGVFDIGSGVAEVVKGLFGLIDDAHTSDEEKAEQRLRVMEMAASGDLAQMKINENEAASENMFVSGWRPAVGWICVTALAWQFIALPIVLTFAGLFGFDTSLIKDAELDALMPILMGMLGMGALRTYEKVTGVARKK